MSFGHGSGEAGRLSQAIDEVLSRRTGNEPFTIWKAVDNFITATSFISLAKSVAADVALTRIANNTATNTADDFAGVVSRPTGVADDFVSEVANNGKGTVWRAPGTTGNGGTVRIMEPTSQYPNGYVRFYNEGGQPLGLNGKPGPNSVTHIPINPDGTYPLPKGWGGAG